MFVDAKDLYLYIQDSGKAHHCWQDVDDPFVLPELGTPCIFRFYGAVSWGHKSELYFVPPSPSPGTRARRSKESFTSKHYIEVMEQLKVKLDEWYPDGSYSIIRDHAKQHTSKASMEAMERLGMHFKEDYPPQSWDINIIENVWGVLTNFIQGGKAKTPNGWQQIIEAAWAKVGQSTIDDLVAGVPARLESIMAAEGAWVPHH